MKQQLLDDFWHISWCQFIGGGQGLYKPWGVGRVFQGEYIPLAVTGMLIMLYLCLTVGYMTTLVTILRVGGHQHYMPQGMQAQNKEGVVLPPSLSG